MSGKQDSTLGAPGSGWRGSEPRDLGRRTWAEAAELGRKSLTHSLTQMLVLPVGEASGWGLHGESDNSSGRARAVGCLQAPFTVPLCVTPLHPSNSPEEGLLFPLVFMRKVRHREVKECDQLGDMGNPGPDVWHG